MGTFTRIVPLVAGLTVLPCAGWAAAPYSQTWSGATTEGWEPNTTSSVVVHDGGDGQPPGSLATRRLLAPPVFDIGATSGDVPEAQGSFAGSPWKVSFDARFDLGSFTELRLRYRFQDAAHNGWYHPFGGPFANSWTSYSVVFDPGWSDAQAMAHGWVQEAGPVVSFAQTMGDVYRTEIRFVLGDDQSALAHIDNFVQAPIPEPQTYALMALGLAALGLAGRRRRVP